MVLWVEGALPCVDAGEARVRFVPIEGPEPNRSLRPTTATGVGVLPVRCRGES
jgi:hypothetical protein